MPIEYNEELLADMIAELEDTYYGVFPDSYINVDVSNLMRNDPAIFIKTGLGKDKSEFQNGYLENDPCHHLFSIEGIFSERAVLEIVIGGRITTKPEPGSYMALGKVKVPFRKVTGGFTKIVQGFEKYLESLRSTIIDNVDIMREEKYDIGRKV